MSKTKKLLAAALPSTSIALSGASESVQLACGAKGTHYDCNAVRYAWQPGQARSNSHN
jgi:hypothetical protein